MWHANDTALEVSNELVIFDACAIVVTNLVVHVDAARDVNIVIWKHVNDGLDYVTVHVTVIVVLDNLHGNVGDWWECQVQNRLHREDIGIFEYVNEEAAGRHGPVVRIDIHMEARAIHFEL